MSVTSGVYKVTNKINGDFYIGSSNNIFRRRREHFRKNFRTQSKSILVNAILKYGRDNFIFEILEFCDNEKLIEREQFYIDLLNPKYNIRRQASSNLGLVPSEKHLQHLKEIGFKKGNKVKNKRSYKVYQLDKEGNMIKEWVSSVDACIGLGLDTGAICRVLKGEYKHTKGFYFTKVLNT